MPIIKVSRVNESKINIFQMNQLSTDLDIVKKLVPGVDTLAVGREDDKERRPLQTVFYLLHLRNFLVR